MLAAGACGGDSAAVSKPEGEDAEPPSQGADAGNGTGAADAGSDAAKAKDASEGDASQGDASKGDAGADAAPPALPRRYLCINGAGVDGPGGRNSGGNSWVEQFCASFGNELIRDCTGSPCYSTFAFEVMTNPSRTLLVSALDTNKDGRVTSADTRFDLVLLGYSWGGTNVRDMAAWMQTDPQFDADRRNVGTLVVIDPYRPGAGMDVPGNVTRFIELRHSVAPPDDCSRLLVGGITISGPYLGLVPRCKSTSQCTDYDYTLGGNTFYPGAFTPGLGYTGVGVDHCGIVNVAAAALPSLLAGKPYSPLPPTVPVAAY